MASSEHSEAESPSNHHVLLFENSDPPEIKQLSGGVKAGHTSLIFEEDEDSAIIQRPLAVILPAGEYFRMLKAADPQRWELLKQEFDQIPGHEMN